MSTMREGFEVVAKRWGYSLERDGARYADDRTNGAWHMWQAAVEWEQEDWSRRLAKIAGTAPASRDV